MPGEVRAKPLNKTKTGNRFRYRGFGERLAAVHVDVSHRVQKVELAPGILSSFFLEKFERWRESDHSAFYKAFVHEVGHHIQSLPLILHHKEVVVDALCRHVAIPDSLARPALLELFPGTSSSSASPNNTQHFVPPISSQPAALVASPNCHDMTKLPPPQCSRVTCAASSIPILGASC